MLLGIDFGTTRTVVAFVDRGNYPIVSFQPDGEETIDYYPSLVAVRDGEITYGFNAAQKQGEKEWYVLRSFKRELGTMGTDDRVRLGGRQLPALEVLTGFVSELRIVLWTEAKLRGEFGAMIGE